MLKKILILPALLVLLMPPLIQAQEDLSGDKSEESGAFESGQASGELSGETSGEPNGQVSGELGWEPNGQPMGQSSLPDESSGSGSDLCKWILLSLFCCDSSSPPKRSQSCHFCMHHLTRLFCLNQRWP
ncbi:unnamed protein product [Eretmochelys imbricata]